MMRRPFPLMAPASLITGLAVALFLVPGLAVAGPVLRGPFRADPYGQFEVQTEGERLSAMLVDGGACRLQDKGPTLEGEFQGSVLVGRLRVCQTGNGCEAEQAYPILAFYNEADNTLVAHVRLRSGCQSPALKQGRFVLHPVRKESPAEAGAVPSNFAADLASKRGSREFEQAREALEQADRLYRDGDYKGAAKHFRLSLGYEAGPLNWPSHFGLGSSLLKLRQVNPAIASLEKALTFNPNNPKILYVLGCAYGQKRNKKKSLVYLKQAVESGYALHEAVKGDPELLNDLGNESEFQALLKLSQDKHPPPSRGTPAPGNP